MKRWTLLLSVGIMLSHTALILACPNCKESVPASDATSPSTVGAGLNNSIYFMLGAFFCVLGMVGYVTVKAVRTSGAAAFPVLPENENPGSAGQAQG